MTEMVAVAASIAVALRLGSTDCEYLRADFVAQPVNAWSSLAFLAAGLFILYGALRQPEARRELLAFGVLVAANALGSFVYHGPAFAWGHWAHDVPAVGVPLFVATHDLGLVLGWPVPRRLLAFAGFLSLVGALLVAFPSATFGLAFVLIAAAGFGELGAFRAGYRPRPSDGWSVWVTVWIFVILSLAAAAGAFLLGRTASALCDPHSVFQYHAVWHVLSAASAAAFAYAGLEHGLARISNDTEAD
jgi:hypothetical protein